MAGINLSDSIAEKRNEHNRSSNGALFVVGGILLLVLASFGGSRLYIMTLNTELATLQATLQESSSRLSGDAVDRVAHFGERMTLITGQDKDSVVDSQVLLQQLESLTLPNVTLTKYEYDAIAKNITVEGTTDNLKYVAQQIVSLKSEAIFSGVKVGDIGRNEDGLITFSLTSSF